MGIAIPGLPVAGMTATGVAGGLPSWLLNLGLMLMGSLDTSKDPLDDFTGADARKLQGILLSLGMKPPYRSGNIEGLENTVAQALVNQLKRSGNFGYQGGGQQMDLSFLDLFKPKTTPTPGMRRRVE